jgi:hypothetical protein
LITVYDNALLKARLSRVTDQKEDVNKAYKANLALPSRAIYKNVPRVYITAESEFMYWNRLVVYILIAFNALETDRSIERVENPVIGGHRQFGNECSKVSSDNKRQEEMLKNKL